MWGRLRRYLGSFSALLLLLLALGPVDRAWTAVLVQDEASVRVRAEEAAAIAWAGHAEQAGALLAGLGRAEPAVFVRVCLALDANDLERVLNLPGLHRLRPDETGFIRALASRRAALPGEDWVTAFQEAWREVGPIDAAAGTPVRGWTERIAVQESASPHKPSDPFWAVATKMQPTTAEVVSVRPLATSSVRKLILVGLLGRGGRGPAARIRRELIDELAAAEPDDMTYVLMRLLDGSTGNQPLSDDDFPALEEAVGRPRFGVSLASLYEAYRSDLEAAADPDPVSHAFTAAIVAFPEAPGTLWLRAKATQEAGLPVAGERLAAVLQRVGRELAVQTSLLARLIGEQTLVRAALLRGDLAGAKAARAELATTLALHREGKVREEYLSGWPVPGLLHELTDRMGRDEIALFRDLVQLPVRADSLPASR